MSNSWDEMRKAKEDSYFAKKDAEALKRIAESQGAEKPRSSPVTGELMEKVVMNGIVVDRCPTSGGIWLDKGELEHIIAALNPPKDAEHTKESWIQGFLETLSGGMLKK